MEQKRLHLLSLHTLIHYGSPKTCTQTELELETLGNSTPPMITSDELSHTYKDTALAEKTISCTLKFPTPTKLVPQRCCLDHLSVPNKHHQTTHE